MPISQHYYIFRKFNFRFPIIIFIAFLTTLTALQSSEMKDDLEEEKNINNTSDKPIGPIQYHDHEKNKINNQPAIIPVLPIPIKKDQPLGFNKRLTILFNHSKAPFLVGTSYEAYADNLLMQNLKELDINSLQAFLKDMSYIHSSIIRKISKYPNLEQLTRFIADHWHFLEATNQLVEKLIAKKYQLNEREVALLRSEVYRGLATMLYLPKQSFYYPTIMKEKLQKAQQELLSILQLSEKLYCELGEYDPYIIQAIADGVISANLAGIKEALRKKNQNPLTPYYKGHQKAFKRVSKLIHINQLPALSCKNYLNGSFTESLQQELLSIIYRKNVSEQTEKDSKKLIKLLDSECMSEKDISETLENLANLNDCLDDDDKNFCKKNDISNCIKEYRLLLISFLTIANQVDQFLYNITSYKKYTSDAPLYFFENPKAIYLIRYFKKLLQKNQQDKMRPNKSIIYQQNNLLDYPFEQQLATVITYSLDLQMNKALQECITKKYSLTSDNKKIILDYTFHEVCSKTFPGIPVIFLPRTSPHVEKVWKRYLVATNWLAILSTIWVNMGYSLHPEKFFPLVQNENIMKDYPCSSDFYKELKTLLENNFNQINNIYRYNFQDDQAYIMKGINRILAEKNQNYLTQNHVSLPFLNEYSSTEHYLNVNTNKITYLILKIIFPNTYEKVIQQLVNQKYIGFKQLYNLRLDIQSKKSKFLTDQFIFSLSKQINAKEEIIKRINAYIEVILLFEPIIFATYKLLDINPLQNGEMVGHSTFAKHQIQAFKALLNSLLHCARTSNQPIDILTNSYKYFAEISNNVHDKSFKEVKNTLSSLDLKNYQKMCDIIIKLNYHKILAVIFNLQYQNQNIELYKEKLWNAISDHIIARSHGKKINAYLREFIFQIKNHQAQSITFNRNLDITIVSQYVTLVEQYLSLIDRLHQSSHIPKYRIGRVLLFILKDSEEKIFKKNLKNLSAQDILSLHHVKLIANNKQSLQLALSQVEWRAFKKAVKPKQSPVQFSPLPIIKNKNNPNIFHRKMGMNNNMKQEDVNTSLALKPYKVDYGLDNNLDQYFDFDLIRNNPFSYKQQPDKHELYKTMYDQIFTQKPVFNTISKVILCHTCGKHIAVLGGIDKLPLIVSKFPRETSQYGKSSILSPNCPLVKQIGQLKKNIPIIIFRPKNIEGWIHNYISNELEAILKYAPKQRSKKVNLTEAVYQQTLLPNQMGEDVHTRKIGQHYSNGQLYHEVIKTEKVEYLDYIRLKSHYWIDHHHYFATYIINLIGFNQPIKVKLFNKNSNLIKTYHLVLKNGCRDLFITTFGPKYFIVSVLDTERSNVVADSFHGSLFLFKKEQSTPLDCINNVAFLHLMKYAIYVPEMDLLLMYTEKGYINAYSLRNEKFKLINKPGDIIGSFAAIPEKNYTKESFLLISVNVPKKELQYHIHRYKVNIDHNKVIHFQKMQKIRYVGIPITHKIDDSDRAKFQLFCSPRQPNYLFLVTLEKLLMINTRTWQVELSLSVLQTKNTGNIYKSDAGIFIGGDRANYALTWEELEKVTMANKIYQ